MGNPHPSARKSLPAPILFADDQGATVLKGIARAPHIFTDGVGSQADVRHG